METHGVDGLEGRISRLERENRRLKLAGLAVLSILAASAIWTACEGAQGLEVERLILLDMQRRTRATLGLEAGEPALRLFDRSGNRRLEIGLLDGGWPKVALFRGSDAAKRLELLVGPDRMEIYMEDDSARGVVNLVADGTRQVAFHDLSGKPIAVLGSQEGGEAVVRAYTKSGEPTPKAAPAAEAAPAKRGKR